jgi:2-polyprenyl-3-methyl-5-hydroxy-6-metoxy-1,4-benzoquinol methylase
MGPHRSNPNPMPAHRSQRQRIPELIDAPELKPEELAPVLRDLRIFNRTTGARMLVHECIRSLARRRPAGRPWTLLDVATGSGDIPQSLARWARRKGIALRITGTDRCGATLNTAREYCADYPQIRFFRSDMRRLPLADGSFDVVVCSQALHHLATDDILLSLAEMWRVARHALVVADLYRSLIGYALVWLMVHTMPTDPRTKHDGPASMRNSFQIREMAGLAKRAGIEPLGSLRFRAVRFALTFLKPPA